MSLVCSQKQRMKLDLLWPYIMLMIILIVSNNFVETDNLKLVLGAEFKLKDLGLVRQYLSMRINVNKNENVITVDQQ